MSTSTKKNVVRGKRYTSEEKNKVGTFVADYNASNGRGGQSAAAKKFGISQLTIATWLRNAGLKTGGQASLGSLSNRKKKRSAMLELGQEIEKIERELKAKRAQFETLKTSL